MQQIILDTILANELATKKVAGDLAKNIIFDTDPKTLVIYLVGNLGSGKTTFSRYFIQAFDWQDKVKSPTYTIVENYKLKNLNIYHLDLYRLADPEELNFLGIEDMCNVQTNNILLIEWPQKAAMFLPPADIRIEFAYIDNIRRIKIVVNNQDERLKK